MTSWTMPPETAEQERIWMAFPPFGTSITADAASADEAHHAWAAVANAISEFEPVTMVSDPSTLDVAQRLLDPQIEVLEAPLNDAWMRDFGPTFVFDEHGTLGAVEWIFNGWGQQDWAQWDKDQHIGHLVAASAGAISVPSPLVNEGGGIHVDGFGTVFVTETVQLDPGRNPGLTKEDIERELTRTIGATNVIWLPRGLWRDSERFGTRGHVDIVATIPAPGTLLVHDQQDPAHPDHEIGAEILDTIRSSRDATGNQWQIIPVPAPATLRDDEGWVDYSYINHVVVNGAVVASSFDDPNDDAARGILAEAYPGRRIVTVDSRPLFARGGGIHCITQQQPRRPTA